MAQPAGSITPSDGGYPATVSAGWSYAHFAFRLPFQPPHWKGGATDKKHCVSVAACVTTPAGRTITEKWVFKGEGWGTKTLPENTTSGNKDCEWVTRNDTVPLVGFSSTYPSLSDPDTLPHYCHGYVAFQEDAASTTEITGLYFELTDADAYTTPTPTGARSVELTDRGTNKVYAADYPASAWHAQWLLCHSMNKICYEARQVWSVPI